MFITEILKKIDDYKLTEIFDWSFRIRADMQNNLFHDPAGL